jgi:hypothetical protein
LLVSLKWLPILFQQNLHQDVVEGFVCRGCGFKTLAQSSASRHECNVINTAFERKRMRVREGAVGKDRNSADDWILLETDLELNLEAFNTFQESIAGLSGRGANISGSLDPWIDCENELVRTLGWGHLDGKKRKELADLIVSLPKDDHLLPDHLKSHLDWFEIKLSEVTKLSSVCRWIAASNGKKSSKSLWRMPEVEETLKRRKERFLQLCSFASQNDNNIDQVISYHFRIVFHTQLV